MKLRRRAGQGLAAIGLRGGRGWLVVALGLLGAGGRAWAGEGDFDDVGEVAAIQNRTYHLGQEFEFSISFLPDDAFYKAVTPEFAYVFHFSDQLAWEAARVGYALTYDTNLKQQLLNLQVSPTYFETIQLFLSSDLLWSPLYGKLAAFNRYVLYGELYAALGGGAFENKVSQWWPAANAGLGLRFFINKTLSLRVEARENLLFENSGLVSVVDLNFGLAINYGSAE